MKTIFGICMVVLVAIGCNDHNDRGADAKKEDPHDAAMDANKETMKETDADRDMKKDMEFAVKAADDGMLEVQLGQLAQQKGTAADVKDMGKMMTTDHTRANEELKALAAKKNITLPTALSKDAQDKYDDLAKKSGTEFDEAYCKAMVKDHEDAIDLFQKEADKGYDAEMKSWAASKLTTLQHHKQMAEACVEARKKK